MLRYETKLWDGNYSLIAGVDEAGRGPLAGPVSACAVIMPKDKIIAGVNDSKQLSEKARERLFEQIIELAVCYSVDTVDEKTIDTINILEATKLAMRRAVAKLNPKPDAVLIDHLTLETGFFELGITHGDALSYSIASASILAKVERDRLMRAYDEMYPEYGFSKNKGYGTKAHIAAIKKYGSCPIHRKSFIKKFL